MDRKLSRRLLVGIILACGCMLLPGLSSAGDEASPLTSLIRKIQTTWTDVNQVGVDRQGHIWVWRAEKELVAVYSPEGQFLESVKVPSGRAVDVDRNWGVIALSVEGNVLQQIPFHKPGKTIALENEAADVTWIASDTVATSPTRSGRRIELWNLKNGFPIDQFGEEKEINSAPGAVLLRSVGLHFDAKQELLYTLESVTGNLQILKLDGTLVREASVTNHDKKKIMDWLQKVDSDAKAENEEQRPFIKSLRLAVDAKGTAWVVEKCSPDTGKAILSKIPLAEKPETLELAVMKPCCSLTFIVIDPFVVFNSGDSNAGNVPEDPCSNLWRLR
ncbi:MAG: hypothetical protein GY856_41700 [bacterium]|nr:hypothetical protein [bacterium]